MLIKIEILTDHFWDISSHYSNFGKLFCSNEVSERNIPEIHQKIRVPGYEKMPG